MTDFQLMKRLRGNNEQKPPPPRSDSAPRLSEKAALVAQQMEALEGELSAALNRSQDMENRALVAEQQLVKTEDKLQAMQTERDYFQRRYIETNAKLRAGAGVILDCIRESEKDMTAEAYKPKSEAHRAVARAVAGGADDEDHPPLPEFLNKPQDSQ